jgi:hypothetical protein
MHALKTAKPAKKEKAGVRTPRLMARNLAQAFKLSPGESKPKIRPNVHDSA